MTFAPCLLFRAKKGQTSISDNQGQGTSRVAVLVSDDWLVLIASGNMDTETDCKVVRNTPVVPSRI